VKLPEKKIDLIIAKMYCTPKEGNILFCLEIL